LSLLSVENLDVYYGQLQALSEVSFEVAEGETVALVGANGAGKTSLLRAIAGAQQASAGRVRLEGVDVTRVPAFGRVAMGIALVPEGRRLFAAMTVEENLLVAATGGRKGRWTIDRVMEVFPMLKARRKARCANLSGGEQQATAIARALMTNPRILLLDEVSLGLSPIAIDLLYKSLHGLIESHATILLVEQDLKRSLHVANRIMCMLEGRIVLAGRPADVTREQIKEAYFGVHREKRRS
jgi:branched-chain amino acid transport system ATP-binding protein